MKEEYINTYKFLKNLISNIGKKTFSEMTIKEYNVLAIKHNLLSAMSIKYITGFDWRNYKSKLLKEERGVI